MNTIAQLSTRTITQLTADRSGWETIEFAKKIARNKFEILPVDSTQAKNVLSQLQITTRSPMGAMVYNTGGILIDDGWIRILGSGSEKLQRSLTEWNKGRTNQNADISLRFLLIADDVVGGFFALNGGAFGKDLGKVFYLAPDRLKWENQNMTYAEFINFCFAGDMNRYYDGLRWSSWKGDVAKVSSDQSFFFYPYLWTNEGKQLEKNTRTIVPVTEVYTFEIDALKQLK